MQQMADGYRGLGVGLGLLLDVNSDRLISVLIILAALAAVGLVGVEYFASVIVQAPAAVSTAMPLGLV